MNAFRLNELTQKAKAAKVKTLAMHAVNEMTQKDLIEYARIQIEARFSASDSASIDRMYEGLSPSQKLSTYPVK